jgi:putative transposase
LKPNICSVARLLTFVTGLVNQELLLKNENLLVENRILKAHLLPGFRLCRPERTALAEIGKRLGRKLLQQVASVANPDTILGWYRHSVGCPAGRGSPRRSSIWWFG